MGASEFYSSLEEKWYGFCDSLQEKGLRVYDFFVDPVEQRGIPSLPVAFALVALLVGALSFAVLGFSWGSAPSSESFSVRVLSGGEGLDEAYVKVYDSEGNYVTSLKTSDGLAEIDLEAGKEYRLDISKDGFQRIEKTVRVEEGHVKIELLPVEGAGEEAEEDDYALLWEEGDFGDESGTGDLTIQARDEDWSPVKGTAYVYDANNDLLVEKVDVDSSGTLFDLELDSEVYVNFEPADSSTYLDYLDGESDPVTIDSGHNQHTIYVEKRGVGGGEEFPTAVRVVDDSTKGLSGVLIDVYRVGGSAPVKDDELTDSSGTVKVDLKAGETYYATAYKSGYLFDVSYSFSAGEEAVIDLHDADESNSAPLTVYLTDEEDGSPVSEATVAAFFQQGDERFQIGPAKKTGESGSAVLGLLERGSNVELRASKGSRHVEAVMLVSNLDKEIAVELVLPLNTAVLRLQAEDWTTSEGLPALFTTYFGGEYDDTCTSAAGSSCDIEVKARREVTLVAETQGYVEMVRTETLTADETREITVRMYDEDLLKGSAVEFLGFYNSLDQPVQSLMLGHEYEAQFSFVASSDAQLSGLFMQFHNYSYAGLTGVYPPAAVVYANTEASDGFIEAKCSYSTPCNWMDAQYAGSKAGDVSFRVKIDDDVPLDEDQKAYLEWGYRSYTAEDAYTLSRNPFDAELGTDVDEPLASGYEAEQYRQGVYVLSPGTSCENGYCVSIQFAQGDETRNEGFEVLSMLNIGEEDVAYAPLQANFQVETYEALGGATYLSLEYDPAHLRFDKTVLNAQLSGEPPFICGGPANTVYSAGDAVSEEWVKSQSVEGVNLRRLTFDVSGLVECTSYANPEYVLQPFVFDGYHEFKPLSATDYTETFTQVSTSSGGGYRSASHGSWLSVTNNDGAYTDYASVEAAFEQRGNEYDPASNPWKAYYNGGCNASEFSDDSCDYGLVKIKLAFTANRRRDQNKLVLETLPTHLQVIAASYYRDGEQTPLSVSESGFRASVGQMNEGETITAIAYAVAVGQDEYSEVTARHVAVDSDGEHGTELVRDVFVAFKPEGETSYGDVDVKNASYSYFDPQKDSCRGRVHLSFDEEARGDQLRLGDDCYSVAMRVSTVFPVDAIPVKVNGADNLLYSVVEDDGSSACYESCNSDGTSCSPGFDAFTSDGDHVLRYNAESPDCPDKFKAIGNVIRDSSVEIEFGAPGGETDTLQITVDNYTDAKSVYLGPIYRSYNEEISFSGEGGRTNEFSEAEYHPQLWAITNHKQTGERHFIIVETDTAEDPERFQALNPHFRIDFEGPGTKTFAYYPHPSKRMVVFEELSNAKPIFVYDSCFEVWDGSGLDQMPWNSEYVASECAAKGDPYWDEIIGLNEEYGITLWPEYVEAEYDVEQGIQDFVCDSTLPPKEFAECTDYRDQLQGWLDEGVDSAYDGNLGYSPAGQLRMFNRAREVANVTAFWRSNKLVYYCAGEEAVAALNENLPENLKHQVNDFSDWEVCRPTIDDWRNMSEDFVLTKTPCTFCNNTLNPDCEDESETHLDTYLQCTYNDGIPVFDCTQQCFAYEFEGELIGRAWVEYGTEFVDDYSVCTTKIGSDNYDGSQTMTKISKSKVASCVSAGNCPLDLLDGNEATCIVDADGDGFRTYETPQPAEAFADEYRCTTGIISVRKQYCLREGLGKKCRLDGYSASTPLDSMTPGEVSACLQAQEGGEHYCSLEVDGEEKPYCFKDVNGDGLFQGEEDVDDYGEQVIQPSVLEGGEYKCTETGLQIMVNKYCNAPCTNYCMPRDAETECDITCGKDGFKWDAEYGFKNQTAWGGALGALQEKSGSFDAGEHLNEIHAEYSSGSEDYSQYTLLPARWFPEYGVEFNYHFPVNSFGKSNSFYGEPDWPEAMRVSTVSGCTVEDDAKYAATSEWGVYDLSAKNVPELSTGQAVWSGHATALHLQKENYLGVQCRKPDDSFSDAELCSPVYSDYSGTYGSCVNSLYLLGDDAVERLGDNFTEFRGRTTNHDFQEPGCILTMGGFLLCLDEDEKWDEDEITGVYGWRQKYSAWTPAGEKKEGEFKWEKEGWRQAFGYGSLLLGASSVGDTIGSLASVFGAKWDVAGGDFAGILNGISTFGIGTNEDGVDGLSILGAGLRGAVQGGMQSAALSYGDCRFGKIVAGAAIQTVGSSAGQAIKYLAQEAQTGEEGEFPWQGVLNTVGSGVDLGAFAINRLAVDWEGNEEGVCQKPTCLHDDDSMVDRAEEVSRATAADYDLRACRQPSINRAEIREK